MNNLNYFYHPSWESREFTQQQYSDELNTLIQVKPGKHLIAKNKSFQVVGTISYLWQTILGWFSKEIQTDPILVNYELLKFLRYGQTHHFFDDAQVKKLVGNLQEILATSKSHSKIADVIAKTLLSTADTREIIKDIEGEISKYFSENESHLHVPKIAKLFETHAALLGENAAMVHHNVGRIRSSENLHDEAVINYERAAVIIPSKPEWQLDLANACIAHATGKVLANDFTEANRFYTKAIVALQKALSQDNPYQSESEEALVKASTMATMISIKLNHFDQAIQTVANCGNPRHLPYDDNPLLEPASAQLGEFYIRLATSICLTRAALSPQEVKGAMALYKHGIAKIADSSNTKRNTAHYASLIMNAYESLAQNSLSNNRIQEATSYLDLAYAEIVHFDEITDHLSHDLREGLIRTIKRLVDAYTQEEKISDAITYQKKLKDLLINQPTDLAECCFELYRLNLAAGNKELALREIEDAYQLAPSNLYTEKYKQLALELAATAIANGHHKMALGFLEKAHKVAPQDWDPIFQLVETHVSLEEWKAAEKWSRTLIAAFPESHEALLQASYMYAKQLDKHAEAVQFAQQAIALSPKEDLRGIIHLYNLTGKIDIVDVNRAIKACEAVLAGNKSEYRAHLQLSNYYIILKYYDKARHHIGEFLKKDNTNAEAYAVLGQIEMCENHLQEALKNYLHAAQLSQTPQIYNEALFECYFAVANQALQNNNDETAFDYYEKALIHAPSKSSILAERFYLLGNKLRESHPAKAFNCYQNAAPHFDQLNIPAKAKTKIYYDLGILYARAQNPGKAIEWFEKAHDLDPSNAVILKELAECHKVLNNLTEARKVYRKLLAADEENAADYHLALANSLAASGKYGKAIDEYISALKRSPDGEVGTITGQIITLSTRLLTTEPLEQNQALALKGFQSALLHLQLVPETHPTQEIVSLYVTLARAAPEENDPLLVSMKNNLYDKALEQPLDPAYASWNAAWIYELAERYASKGEITLAAPLFEKAHRLQPDNKQYRERNFGAAEKLGTLYCERDTHDPSQAKQSLLSLISLINKNPLAAEINKALGGQSYFSNWGIGSKSEENQMLDAIQKELPKANTPQDIEDYGNRLCDLLENAYNGIGTHLPADKMPELLKTSIASLRIKLEAMHDYYFILNKMTDDLVKTAIANGFGKIFENWVMLSPLENLEQADEITKRAKDVLKVIQDVGVGISLQMQTQMEALSKFLVPHAWLHLAIPHLEKIVELSATYGELHSKLITAYFLTGNAVKAIALHADFKNRFPEYSEAKLDGKECLRIAGEAKRSQSLSKEQLFTVYSFAANELLASEEVEPALQAFQGALTHAEPAEISKICAKIIDLFKNLNDQTNSGQILLAYQILEPHKEWLEIELREKIALYKRVSNAAIYQKNYPLAVQCLERVIQLETDAKIPVNIQLRFDVAELYTKMGDFENALDYYKRVAQLQKDFPGINKKIYSTLITLGNEKYTTGAVEQQREQLFKKSEDQLTVTRKKLQIFLEDLPRTQEYKEISTALGGVLGIWSDIKKLKAITANLPFTGPELYSQGKEALALIKKVYQNKKKEDIPEAVMGHVSLLEQQLDQLNESLMALQKLPAKPAKMKTSSKQLILDGCKAFLEAIQVDNTYGPHYNQLIAGYFLVGDSAKSATLYKQFKETFPDKSLVVPIKAYVDVTKTFFSRGKEGQKTALKFIDLKIQEFPKEQELRMAKSNLHVQIAKAIMAENSTDESLKLEDLNDVSVDDGSDLSTTKQKYNAAFEQYKQALNCGVQPNLSYYEGLGDLYLAALRDHVYFNSDIPDTANKRNEYFKQMVTNFERAQAMDPSNGEYTFKIGKFLFDSINVEFLPGDPVEYLTKAVSIDPRNRLYTALLVQALKNTKSDADMIKVAEDHLAYIDSKA